MGETSQVMAERGAIVIATDINCIDLQNPRMVTIGQTPGNLQETIANAKPIPLENVRFARIQCDSALLPFASGMFDVVFSRGTWHHYLDMGRVAAECARILRPGGLLVVCSEPLRAREDDERDYLADIIDYQEGISEQAPTWDMYESALASTGFGNMRVYGMYLAYGHTVNRRMSRWWNFWRRKEPGPREGMVFSGARLRQLHRIAGCMNLTAEKVASADTLSPRLPVGEPILETRFLRNVFDNLPAINKAYRSVFPSRLRNSRIDCSKEAERFQVMGLRPPERVDNPFSFGLKFVRFYLSGQRNRMTMRLIAVPGQSDAKMSIDVFINDQSLGQITVDWEGEKEFSFPVPDDGAPVLEVRLEHDRLWLGSFPHDAPQRELGVGVREVGLYGQE